LARNSTVHSTSLDFLDVPARRRMDSRRRCRAKRSRSPGRSVLIASSRPAPPYLNVSSIHTNTGVRKSARSQYERWNTLTIAHRMKTHSRDCSSTSPSFSPPSSKLRIEIIEHGRNFVLLLDWRR
jgi:hypothetical protein